MLQHAVLSVLFVLAMTTGTGCTSINWTHPDFWYRMHPGYDDRAASIRSVAVLPPDAKVYRLGLVGPSELVADWSEAAKENLTGALAGRPATELRFALKLFPVPAAGPARQEYEEARPLFEAVANAALRAAYGREQDGNPRLKDRIEYSLGPLPSLGEVSGSDALLFVAAFDHVSTAARTGVLAGGAWMNAAARMPSVSSRGPIVRGQIVVPSPVVGPLVPVGSTAMAGLPGAIGQAWIVAALVEPRSGDVLWFDARLDRPDGRADDNLRGADSARRLVDVMLRDLAHVALRTTAPKGSR